MKRIARNQLTPEERELRSRLAQLVTSVGFVRGTLQERQTTCGKPNCRCVRGERHKTLYLVTSVDGKPRQLYIPKALHDTVREWVEGYHRIREQLEGLSERQWRKIKRREM